MSDIFQVLADETRREILLLLLEEYRAERETRVSDMVARLGLSQPTVSKHLRVLRDAELVSVREERQNRFYTLQPAPLHEAEDFLLRFLAVGVETSISVQYLDENGQPVSGEGGLAAGAGENTGDCEKQILPAGAAKAASDIGRVAAKATKQVKEIVARFKLGS
ncbi:MAG: metalloregulator ArsR/SmtB family transcription factor [Microbacteriaceae bacterium]|nr:metalloregulator ArsR/SmtB family transcription factor [Microbacteriaceae bacterium]